MDLGETEQEGEREAWPWPGRLTTGAGNQTNSAGWCEVTALFSGSQLWGLEFRETVASSSPVGLQGWAGLSLEEAGTEHFFSHSTVRS